MEMNEDYCNIHAYMQNRELSWLRFNERVLQEAQDENMPLLERLKFVSIFSSNLDEFFMIRVGSLFYLLGEKKTGTDNKTGMSAQEQLDRIFETVRILYLQRDRTYCEVIKQLETFGVSQLLMSDLNLDEKTYLKQYFSRYILPILSPQIVDQHHPFPFIPNKRPYIALQLKYSEQEKNKDKSKGKSKNRVQEQEPFVLGLIPVPETVAELIFLPGDEIRFVPATEVIREFTHLIFEMYRVEDKITFYVTRNADINFEDEYIDMLDDFRVAMKKLLKKRNRQEIVRLETEQRLNGWLKDVLSEKLAIDEWQILLSRTPVLMNYDGQIASVLENKVKNKLYYRTFRSQPSVALNGESVLHQVIKKDILISYPYESIEPFLRMVKESAHDTSVVSIKITIYRLAHKAKLVEYLCEAAENGKEVVVLIELRARFDEQNNIDWSERLEEAGCRLIYGIGDFKVHSKICLITRKHHGEFQYITQVGTGNYNEKTTELYTDFSLITSNQDIGKDAAEFFKNMTISNLSGDYKHLLVAPYCMKSKIIEMIDGEIQKKEEGRIGIKINSITDFGIIEKLKEASEAGVKIEMIVRGICCILPGVPCVTENIHIESLVGRFLEHSRIYRFGSGEAQRLYISSADFMTRNMERRVEVACPIYSQDIKDQINEIFDSMFYDTEKARIMQSDGTYIKKPEKMNRVNIQELSIEKAKMKTITQVKKERKMKKSLRGSLSLVFTEIGNYLRIKDERDK